MDQVTLFGQTWQEFVAELFEYEECSDCGGDVEHHAPAVVFGHWFARCVPVTVCLIATAEIVSPRFATVAEAEAWIAEREKTDPEGVIAGNYGINAPEGWEGI